MNNALKVTELIFGKPKYTTSLYTAGIARFPTTPGQHVIILHAPYLFGLSSTDQNEILHFARRFANEVRAETKVRRCGFGYDGHQCLQIIPMHGLGDDWKPILAPDAALDETSPGFLWTKSSPAMSDERLEEIRKKIAAASGWTAPDYTFLGDAADSNLFARLVRGEISQWRVWEDAQHVAFLTPFANTPGYTVLIPRKHLPSDIFSLDEKDYEDLMGATRKAVAAIQTGMKTDRVGMFFEGFEIDYTHVKIPPVLGDHAQEGPSDEWHETYPGYITTRLGPEQTDASKLEAWR